MSEFGLEIYAGNGALVLGMQHFTLQKIFETVIPAQVSGRQAGARNDYILLNVPGYNPETCFVLITPRVYSSADQSIGDTNYTPVYWDLGGEQIGIVTYSNYSYYNGQRFVDYNQSLSVECTVEVVKVLS